MSVPHFMSITVVDMSIKNQKSHYFGEENLEYQYNSIQPFATMNICKKKRKKEKAILSVFVEI